MLAWLYASRALIFLGLFLIRDQPLVILVVAVLGGVSMAGTVAMSSALTAEIFGRLSVGSVFGTMFLVHQVGGGVGSWMSERCTRRRVATARRSSSTARCCSSPPC